MIKRNPAVAIVGATGAVGQELMTLMKERSFGVSRLALVASERSAGRKVEHLGVDYSVQDLKSFDFSQVDIAFFSAGTPVSRVWAKKAADQGALVIDNTNAFRMDVDSPLVVPQVNAETLKTRPKSGIIANPNCSTIQMVRVLGPIRKCFGVSQVVVSTYQAASGGGTTGMEELMADARAMLIDRPLGAGYAKKFPAPLAFNVVPQVDVFMDNGFTLEEQKMVQESRKILGVPDLRLTATAVRVPVLNGHSEAVYVETETEIDRVQLIKELRKAEEVIVDDYTSPAGYTTPRFMKSKNHVHVGRIRINPDNKKGMWCWIVADNLRIGAALNAIQIAEHLTTSRFGFN